MLCLSWPAATKRRDILSVEIIEVAPLAFMRGRTLSDAFVILDEAQNTTREQMKMFLTRIGVGSKTVVTGDPTQVSLPSRQRSGLAHCLKILRNVQGICLSSCLSQMSFVIRLSQPSSEHMGSTLPANKSAEKNVEESDKTTRQRPLRRIQEVRTCLSAPGAF